MRCLNIFAVLTGMILKVLNFTELGGPYLKHEFFFQSAFTSFKETVNHLYIPDV